MAIAVVGDATGARGANSRQGGKIGGGGAVHVEPAAKEQSRSLRRVGARARRRWRRRPGGGGSETERPQRREDQEGDPSAIFHGFCDLAARQDHRQGRAKVSAVSFGVAFETEVDDILRELLRVPGTLAARLGQVGAPSEDDGDERRLPLGAGAELVVTVGVEPPAELPQAIEQAARELRSCIRRYGLEAVPDMRLSGRVPRSRAVLLRRTEALLAAFAAMHGATCACVLRGPELLAIGGALDNERRDRLPFLRKRLDAASERQRGKSSHGEVVGDDVFARKFWFDAYLVVFFGGEGWSVDFVRHRARAVARELAVVMPHLDDDPPSPANVRPLPTPPR